jgi:hypothetical protein
VKRLVLLALAACGGSKAAPTAAPQDDYVPEYDADAGPDLVLPLELAAERACACTDDDCREAARDSLSAMDDVTFPRSSRYHHILVELARCLGPVLGEHHAQDYPVLVALADQACACGDSTCGTEVLKRMRVWEDTGGTIRSVVLAVHDFIDLTSRIAQCSHAWDFDG